MFIHPTSINKRQGHAAEFHTDLTLPTAWCSQQIVGWKITTLRWPCNHLPHSAHSKFYPNTPGSGSTTSLHFVTSSHGLERHFDQFLLFLPRSVRLVRRENCPDRGNLQSCAKESSENIRVETNPLSISLPFAKNIRTLSPYGTSTLPVLICFRETAALSISFVFIQCVCVCLGVHPCKKIALPSSKGTEFKWCCRSTQLVSFRRQPRLLLLWWEAAI